VNEPVAWAVVFTRDTDLHRMVLFKEQARAEQYAGDPLKPHEIPMRIRPLVFGDDDAPR
jgi:hypothetical protein